MAMRKKIRVWRLRIRLGAMIALVALGVMLIPIQMGGQAPQAGPVYKVLHAFTGGADGAGPRANVIFDPTRKLLVGTTTGGDFGSGTVFAVNPVTGQETVLYNFPGGVDGAWPLGGVVRDSSDNLYGTTWSGGTEGGGTVFKLNTAGQETVIYGFKGFSGSPADGRVPTAGVIRDSSGNLYGTTIAGGNLGCSTLYGNGCGIVFEVSPAGVETVLYAFTSGDDGSNPYAGVIFDASGNLVGTTTNGGAYGAGTVFQVYPATGQETVLYSFTGGSDGGDPVGGVIQDSLGNFYGTTQYGGVSCQDGLDTCGVVFELSPGGQETVLYSFTDGTDGAYPQAGVIRDSAGNLYGTTSSNGGVFQLSPSGVLTVLHTFTCGTDGCEPAAPLFRDAKGNLYGTTTYGGHLSGCDGSGCGVVFKLTP